MFWRRACERGLVADATIADSLEQAKAFWRIREMFGEVQRHEGGSIKHDVSVPVAAVPAFIAEADAAVAALIPGARPLPFGHLGDGNIHYNVSSRSAPTRRIFSALGRGERRGVRRGEEARRLDLGRARHRRDQARPVAGGEGSGRARPHAQPQAPARSQGHPQSGQGACSCNGRVIPDRKTATVDLLGFLPACAGARRGASAATARAGFRRSVALAQPAR